MQNKSKRGNKAASTKQPAKNERSNKIRSFGKKSDYLYSMSMAPKIDEEMHWFQMLPALFFTACIISIVRMHNYHRPMSQFFWTNSGNDLTDFFSYYKMTAIVICAVLALIFLLYRVFTQSFFIKRSPYYIPMAVYSVFVLISYGLSDYKEFALWGWNDRFEGTITLLAYMVMLFFVINTVNHENNIKWVIYPTAVVSVLLGILGVSQALNHDFFQTALGKKIITPTWFWNQLENLTFTFKNREIYQTVYNINYVSFYLTLLLPLFGLLFIHSFIRGKEEPIWKKLLWGGLFSLNMYNLIGSQSSGGFLGMFAVVIIALILVNKKVINWWHPLLILLVLTLAIGGITYQRWMPELTGAAHGVLGAKQGSLSTNRQEENSDEKSPSNTENKMYIDHIVTEGNDIHINYEGNEVIFTTYPENPLTIKIADSDGKMLNISPIDEANNTFSINDKRFSSFTIAPAQDASGINYLIINIDQTEWPFVIMKGHDVRFRNALGNLVSLNKVPAIGWSDNQGFGSGRGYIWSRTLPMMKSTALIGHGADTYCIYFPQNDYVGKYNADWALNLIIDKPHNMYFGAWIGTGGISVLALCALWLIYILQSISCFWKRDFHTFIEFAGLGIFLGVCGFLVSGLVDDSSVSVMPMFYGLLGTGIAINMMLKKA